MADATIFLSDSKTSMLLHRSSVVAPFLRGQERPTRWEWICSYSIHSVKLTSSTEIHSSIAIRFTFLAKFIEITTPPTAIFTELFRFQNFGHLTSLAKTNTQFPDISLIKTNFNDDAQTTPL
ncbi:hypothetical protein F2Q70_00016238 [Brassica cretica]|uniref:Uncharacterized protein n=1 Tax=Brassica cretica TaxID=69181 RepID=A0A8S9KZJ5_BRACR|nr:hypothetical protein F2Q70_00016238 [Brassica cretica]KAF2598626.1 hypothetical protein F2Q68_00009223 [Brassica cretica]